LAGTGPFEKWKLRKSGNFECIRHSNGGRSSPNISSAKGGAGRAEEKIREKGSKCRRDLRKVNHKYTNLSRGPGTNA